MPRDALIDVANLDLDHVVDDIEAIRTHNPQRFEFEQLSRITHADLEAGAAVGVLEIPEKVWWARGHCPGRPLMPGVLMVEAAAQLSSWIAHHLYDRAEGDTRMFGFGGIEGVKFRDAVVPPGELVLAAKCVEMRSRRARFDTQAWVRSNLGRMVFEGQIIGMWV